MKKTKYICPKCGHTMYDYSVPKLKKSVWVCDNIFCLNSYIEGEKDTGRKPIIDHCETSDFIRDKEDGACLS